MALSDTPKFHENMGFVCNVSAIKGKWIIEGIVLSSGAAINWLNREFFEIPEQKSQFDNFDEMCRTSVPGAKGLISLNSYLGKGTPNLDAYAKGAYVNIGLNNTKGDFARAMLEGIVSDLYDNVSLISETTTGAGSKICRCSGGLAKLDLFNQIQADTYNVPVIYSNNSEATGTGAWMQAMIALGISKTYKDAYELVAGKDKEQTFQPNAVNHAMYNKIRKVRKHYEERIDTKYIHEVLNS